MSIFDRKKNEPTSDDIAARLNQYVGQTNPAIPTVPPAPPPPPAPESAPDSAEEPASAVLNPPTEPEILGYRPLETDTLREQAEEPAVEQEGMDVGPDTNMFSIERLQQEIRQQQLERTPQEAAAAPTGRATNMFSVVGPSATAQRGFIPSQPQSLQDTGLTQPFVADLVVRVLYQANELIGAAMAERVALPFAVVGPILEGLRHDQEVEVKAQRGIGDAGYLYGITEKGVRHARDSMEKLTYTGPAPVPLDDYIQSVLGQTVRNVMVTQENIREAFKDLIINDSVLDEVGPAVNSGASMFLFGHPGNGKTAIAERITKLLGDFIFVPYAVEVDGSVIKVFDAINHAPYEEKGLGGQARRPDWDTRWVKIERPVVMVGGELTMDSLDLLYNPQTKLYEAPLQMKANGGMFLIDDFGRQMIRPQDLLNRWIVPLEKRVDFLNLASGKKIAIPFEQLIVFSTNLDPRDLVDDAFLRRIKFKINVGDPDEDQFRAIFQLMCNRRGMQYDEQGLQYMLDTHYRPVGRPLRMCQPRDIIDQIISIARYKMVAPEMSSSLLDRACETYFVTFSD